MSASVVTRKQMFSDEFRANVVAKYEAGYSYADIEREFGVGGPTIMAWVHAAGKKANRLSRVAPSSAEFRQMQDLLIEQESTIEEQEGIIDAQKRVIAARDKRIRELEKQLKRKTT